MGLVGRNGAGRTTLFRIIVGEEEPDDGQVTIEAGMTLVNFSQGAGTCRESARRRFDAKREAPYEPATNLPASAAAKCAN